MLAGDFFAPWRGQTENMENNRNNTFLTGPILGPLVRFALPLMLSLLLQAFYGGADLAGVPGVYGQSPRRALCAPSR